VQRTDKSITTVNYNDDYGAFIS